MHSSNTPHRLNARLVFSGCPLSRWVQRLRFIAPHGGIAAMNGTMQNSTHSGACEVIAVTSENAATIHTQIVGIETCRWPNLSTSLPSIGLAMASEMACTAVSAPASE